MLDSVSQEQADAAIEFGVNTPDGQTDAKLYILAFLQKLLHQREKVDRGLLTNYLKSATAIAWKEVLSVLEERKRKVLDIKSGSLVFALFCPTAESSLQFEDETWIQNVLEKLKQLIYSLGKRTRFVVSDL